MINNTIHYNKKFILLSTFAFTLACLIVIILCTQYYIQVKNTIKNDSKDYILEISKQMENNISRNINDNFSALKSIAVSLEDSHSNTFEDISKKAKELQSYWKYKKILVIDQNANSFDESGTMIRLNNDQYLQDAIIGKKPSLSASEQIDGEECIVFALPSEFNVEDKQIVAIAATYELETFDQVLSMGAFDQKADAHIINSDGTIVIRSSSETVFTPGYNILNWFEKETKQIKVLDNIRLDIKNAEEGFEELKVSQKNVYISYISLNSSIENGNWRLMTIVPTSVVNLKSNLLLSFTLIISGIITITFAVLVGVIIIANIKNRRRLEKIAFVDDITKGHTIKYFTQNVEKILQNTKSLEYMLIYINIEKFKVLNDQYGRKECDELLYSLNTCFQQTLQSTELIGRLYADNFCMLLKNHGKEELIQRIKNWKLDFLKNYAISIKFSFILDFGVYLIEDPTIPLDVMKDRAKLSLSVQNPLILDSFKVSIYNEKIRQSMMREKMLEDQMEKALENHEFVVYLQPKYTTSTDKIGGAEALVRWVNKNEGMIYPNEFIPIFEKNGFIKKLDLFVFETVCILIRKWIDNNQTFTKISINCSREHLKDSNFLDAYIKIANKYNIPREYLEIEFTENIVFEDVKYFTEIIHSIHSAGFGCSLDDFGSGYSSLSMIQDIPVDTIKLDKVFFFGRSQESASRTESVVASIITMSKALSVTTVAEGVEDENQVLMLKRLGCDLIQGYYYAKPMPIEEFEKLLFSKDNGVKNEKK